MQDTLSQEYQGDTVSKIEDMLNQFEIEEDDYDIEKIVDHYFKNNVLFLKFRYVGDTPG